MPYFIGRRGETYPEPKPPATQQLVIRQGTDAPVSGLDVAPAPFFPRDGSANPLRVTFPAFTAGDVLEVEAWLSGGGVTTSTSLADMQIAVSIDGGTTFYAALPGEAAARVVVDASNGAFSLSAYWNCLLTDPMPVFSSSGSPPSVLHPITAPPIVQLRNLSNYTISVAGAGPQGLGQIGELWLLARELNPALVFQGPQGILVTIPPT